MQTDLQADPANVVWLDHTRLVSMDMLADLSGLSEGDLLELIELGAIVPADPVTEPSLFSAECIVTVRIAKRLRHDLELDTHALALALTLLGRIRSLEAELEGLRAQLPAGGRG